MKTSGLLASAIGALAILSLSAARPVAQEAPTAAPAISPAALKAALAISYLKGAAPGSLTLLPAPPAPGSAAQARDDDAAKAALALNGSPRWNQAASDADLSFPHAANTFSCALGVEVSQAETPHLYRLLAGSLVDIGLSTYPTKTKYHRVRPFMVNSAPICTPGDEAGLRKDGSYPSGHSAVGWGWALILTEAAPGRADAILARGRAFGQSRVVCNVHWLSDTEEGRVMGAATVAKLNSVPEFLADLDAAKAEIAAARAAGHTPTRDCAAEAAALAGKP